MDDRRNLYVGYPAAMELSDVEMHFALYFGREGNVLNQPNGSGLWLIGRVTTSEIVQWVKDIFPNGIKMEPVAEPLP